jgi:hypothetical protein
LGALAVAAVVASSLRAQSPVEAPKVDADDIGGVLTGARGPEAGVWVIAETAGQPVRYAKIVVTDDSGRFVVPDLPAGDYKVWARGYGLVDTAAVQARPGAVVRLTARDATPAEAAKVYPAAYWFSMLKVPPASAFSGAGRDPGIASTYTSQGQWLGQIKNEGCVGCHQLGNLATRTLPAAFRTLGSTDAWVRRVQSGQAGPEMIQQLVGMGPTAARNFADWTDRIAAGELPATKPERPQGLERNVVVTVRDWLDGQHYLHDLISTDRRNPTVNGYGKLYGATELSTNQIPILDPKTNVATTFSAPFGTAPIAARETPLQPSAYWGDKAIWDSRANMHNPMLDQTGRVWLTAAGRGPDNPAFCKAGSDHPSAKAFPNARSGRQLAVLDPKTGKYTFIDTCFGTHHLQFDKNDVLWTSGGGPVVGWLDMKTLDRTGDAAQSQGWTPLILDTNGNGRRDAFVEPNAPADPAKDRRLGMGFYAVMPNPADGSVWGSVAFSYPGSIIRLAPGADPSRTALAEVYNVPLPGFSVRGADIDSKGVVWVSLGSGHLGEFDRRKCKGPLNGPQATGDQCPEGWTFHRLPGPAFAAVPEQSVESSYYTWVDQHDTLGLGKDVPVVTGNLFDGLHAYVGGRFITLRTPYPLGFYAKGLDGRIDDPAAGWKGRGLWTSSGDRVPWHMEGGKGNKPLALHFQIRPNPLAS